MKNDLPKPESGARWWLVLVTFENSGDSLEIFSSEHQGAVGWMAVVAKDEDELVDRLQESLSADGYNFVEGDDLRVVKSIHDIEEIDDYLAANVRELEPAKFVVWGTVHRYLADAEA